jgi:hypothetical protein
MEGDDEELSFISIATATANALRFLGLDKQKNEPSNDETNARDGTEQSIDTRRAFVDRRLRDLREFERRVSGTDRPLRKRNNY